MMKADVTHAMDANGDPALYKATFGDQPFATVSNWIITNSTAGVITGNGNGTPNRLLLKSTL
jgi:hypothetical protein